MKRNIQFAAMALLIAPAALAQENISIGPIAGVSIANFWGGLPSKAWKPGLTAGGFVNYSANSGFGVSGQILFTQLGTGDKVGDDFIRLNYIQVPILATYFLGKYGQAVRPKLFIGPHFNYLLRGNNKVIIDVYSPANNQKPFKSFDAGLTAGFGLNVRLKKKIWLNTDLRYGLGLIPVGRPQAVKLYNQNFGVNVGVSFPLARYSPGTGKFSSR